MIFFKEISFWIISEPWLKIIWIFFERNVELFGNFIWKYFWQKNTLKFLERIFLNSFWTLFFQFFLWKTIFEIILNLFRNFVSQKILDKISEPFSTFLNFFQNIFFWKISWVFLELLNFFWKRSNSWTYFLKILGKFAGKYFFKKSWKFVEIFSKSGRKNFCKMKCWEMFLKKMFFSKKLEAFCKFFGKAFGKYLKLFSIHLFLKKGFRKVVENYSKNILQKTLLKFFWNF